MVASKMASTKHGGDRRSDTAKVQNCTSVDDAAKSMNVSPRSVKTANQVNELGSEAVKQAVENGSLPVSTAAEFVKAVPDKAKQSEIVKKGPKKVRETLRQTKLELAVEPEPAASDAANIGSEDRNLEEMKLIWSRCDDETKEAIRKFITTPSDHEYVLELFRSCTDRVGLLETLVLDLTEKEHRKICNKDTEEQD
jgi:anti-sigma28 factor (negative regulator of flagellin synthesis)